VRLYALDALEDDTDVLSRVSLHMFVACSLTVGATGCSCAAILNLFNRSSLLILLVDVKLCTVARYAAVSAHLSWIFTDVLSFSEVVSLAPIHIYSAVTPGGKEIHVCCQTLSINVSRSTGRGIGRACALAFATHGASRVLVADLDHAAACRVAEECQAMASSVDFQAMATQVDVCSEQSVGQATSMATHVFGRIDYCVNSAGISNLSL
jgi:hypothetical protein